MRFSEAVLAALDVYQSLQYSDLKGGFIAAIRIVATVSTALVAVAGRLFCFSTIQQIKH